MAKSQVFNLWGANWRNVLYVVRKWCWNFANVLLGDRSGNRP